MLARKKDAGTDLPARSSTSSKPPTSASSAHKSASTGAVELAKPGKCWRLTWNVLFKYNYATLLDDD